MKKILLAASLIGFGSFFYKGNAQPCTLGVPGVKWNYSIQDGPNCRIGIDLYFDLDHNAGGKWVWVHIWPTSSYSNWNYSSPPTVANGGLVGSIATVGAEHQGANLLVASSYLPDNTAPGFQSAGISVYESPGGILNSERYTFKNIELVIPGGCNIPQSFEADVWESQSAQSQQVHCFSKGLEFYANDPKITGLLYCLSPRQYKFDITSLNTAGLTVNYNVYIDVDGNGIYNPSVDVININSGTATMNAGNNYKFSSGILDYLPYSNTKPYADLPLWVVVTGATIPNEVYGFIANSCIPLPVQFAAFTSQRNKETVELKWATASESNNKGFYIERKNADQSWQQLGFIATKAYNGNSTDLLQYLFNDYNTVKSVSQYRIAQIDLDGRIYYSDIRLVKGFGQATNLLVYPNPSPDGIVNVMLENRTATTVLQLLDINGRLVKSWANISNDKLVIENIKSGIYILRAWPGDGNEPVNVKIFVGK
ncbi:MAG TPA: T9SS type A sorting domain-containing protein [Chitinophagaceae bacterium]|nr:T9SS type A sorting domain-containing protein [Chitinophagaceae bacterium]